MKKEDTRFIAVVMGYENPLVRNNEALELLNYGFANYSLIEVVKKGEELGHISSILYKNSIIKIVASKSIYVLAKKGTEKDYTKQFNYTITKNNYKGYIGNIDVIYNNDTKGSAYLILENSEKKNFFELWIDVIKHIFL